MIPLTDEENKFYEEKKVCNICKKGFSIDNDKKRHRFRDHCLYNLKYKTPKETPIVFHNCCTYD